MREVIFSAILFVCFECSNPDGIFKVEGEGLLSPIEFEYKGHSYIEFRAVRGVNVSGVVHNPDCPCHKNNLNK